MKENNITLHNENCVDVMQHIDNNSIDAIVTDPPYGIAFMNKKWDSDVPQTNTWKEALRILKPGAHILAACGTRTYHRMATNIEDAGFIIRDICVWAYGSGMPKSLNISKDIDRQLGCERDVVGERNNGAGNKPNGNSFDDDNYVWSKNINVTLPASPKAKQWDGWGNALKPAIELWCLAQKPISEKNIAQNVLKWGTGGINVDRCRIGGEPWQKHTATGFAKDKFFWNGEKTIIEKQPHQLGRFPANLMLSDDQEVLDLFPSTKSTNKHHNTNTPNDRSRENCIQFSENKHQFNYGNENNNSTSRFFYVSKSSPRERNLGLQEGQKNIHPTCKPITLMQYLCRLITPPNGIILDPFLGSGTTAIAAHLEGFRFVGCEIDTQYFDIAKQRVAYYKYAQTDI